RSWKISTIVVVVLTILWAFVRPSQFWALFDRLGQDIKGVVVSLILSAYIFNLVPDYISALQTQYFVRFIQRKQQRSSITLAIVIADFLSKTLIFLLFYCAAMMGLLSLLSTFLKDFRELWGNIGLTSLSDALRSFFQYGLTLSVEKRGNPSIG